LAQVWSIWQTSPKPGHLGTSKLNVRARSWDLQTRSPRLTGSQESTSTGHIGRKAWNGASDAQPLKSHAGRGKSRTGWQNSTGAPQSN